MTAHRRYYFQHEGAWPAGAHTKVLETLQHACEACWWFNEPSVEGEPFEKLSFAFTVSANDQWRAHRRAMKLALDCYYVLGLSEHSVPEPMWETLAPHTNRGHHRLPR